ncbi:hypothetical protein G3465_11810 [Shewanella baltica]|uniref:hypothetical protein n=1 Tax=Shewanella TaxID=22 RepID=UPI00217DEAB1|nr:MULTISPECIES: hypothetical protein [Shewanella]MCS6153584.1 hypothetical protein [Shewanella baltica]MCU8023472.1 hypothetical protein [Shewanella sp. SM78]MCU8080509.1 hypothetical protein [Shewanella sp. SM103]
MSASRIKPAIQGHLDGACGFYAIVNAIHLLEPDIPQQELFNIAFSTFIQDGNPMAFIEGTSRGTIKNVLSRLLEYIHSTYELTDNKTNEPYRIKFSIPYWVKDNERSRKDVIDTLSQTNYRKGTVCILGFAMNDGELDYAHWTVIKGFKDGCFNTHDSSGEAKKIDMDTIRVDSQQRKNSQRPYNFISADIFVIERIVE